MRAEMTGASGKCVLLWSLDRKTLPLAALHRLLGRRVFYRDLAKGLRGPCVREALGRFGIARIPYETFAGFDYFEHLTVVADLAEKGVDALPASLLDHLATGLYRDVPEARRKIEAHLFDDMGKRLWNHAQLVVAARHLRRRGFSPSIQRDLGSWSQQVLEAGASEFPPALPDWVQGLGLALLFAADVVRRLGRRLTLSAPAGTGGAGPVSGATMPRRDEAPVLFFPHQSPFYGKLFLKDHFYSDDPASPLHPSRIVHVELTPADAEIADNYRQLGLAFDVMSPIAARQADLRAFRDAWSTWRRTEAGRVRIDPRRSLATQFTLLRLYALYRGYVRALATYPAARLALVGYDMLFPKALVLALQSRGAKVVANMERLSMIYRPTSALIFDEYYVAGPAAVEDLAARRFMAIGEVVPTGLARVDRLRHLEPMWPTARGDKARVLVLDYHSLPECLHPNGPETTSWCTNRLFYMAIIKLALEFPEAEFVIRSKNIVWQSLEYFKDIVFFMNCLPNIWMQGASEPLDMTYRYAAGCDLAVCRHTSLIDELMTVGKPVVCYEETGLGGPLNVSVTDYKEAPVLLSSFEEVRRVFAELVGQDRAQAGRWMADWRARLFGAATSADVRPAMAGRLAALLSEGRAGARNTN